MTRTNKENQVSAAVKPAAAPRCIWTSDDDVVLLQVLRQEKVNGGQSDSGWKSVVWTTALAELKVKGDNKGAPKTASKISDHFANVCSLFWFFLKANFVQVKKLREQSGFGWDDVTKLVIASNDTWDAYIKSHPNMAKWRRTPFPLYDDMLFLVDGIVATGEGAFHAGGDLASSEPGYSSPPTIPEDDEDDSSNDASPGGTGKTQPVIDEPGSIDDEDSQDTTPSRKVSLFVVIFSLYSHSHCRLLQREPP
ncbi:hypothetical protein BDN72DRAFT_775130 [Pluteus cervinus]|uniref:Uncharacterized protein n=1 Tax=Pluteus cervinus TaxID=181527 RepID=A0ACD3AEG7_9AGAR|nr:hypothetical protein BDN72DRAFT_775130 [Pluteus cervinus]